MKKVLFVLAFVAVYGVSMAMTSNKQTVSVDNTVSVVVDVEDNTVTPEVEKEKKATKNDAKAKGEGCSDSKAKAKGCCGTKAKSEGCSGEKSAKKADCGSSCDGKK
uniref:hypothetical protein n=1 Tax=uncultured Draconibacterium sp. TaxID=1573823 RepID=UPI003216AEF3